MKTGGSGPPSHPRPSSEEAFTSQHRTRGRRGYIFKWRCLADHARVHGPPCLARRAPRVCLVPRLSRSGCPGCVRERRPASARRWRLLGRGVARPHAAPAAGGLRVVRRGVDQARGAGEHSRSHRAPPARRHGVPLAGGRGSGPARAGPRRRSRRAVARPDGGARAGGRAPPGVCGRRGVSAASLRHARAEGAGHVGGDGPGRAHAPRAGPRRARGRGGRQARAALVQRGAGHPPVGRAALGAAKDAVGREPRANPHSP
jgi:hypothetical protein